MHMLKSSPQSAGPECDRLGAHSPSSGSPASSHSVSPHGHPLGRRGVRSLGGEHVQQRKQIVAYRQAWDEAGHIRRPRVSVSRSIFALTTDLGRANFGQDRHTSDQVGAGLVGWRATRQPPTGSRPPRRADAAPSDSASSWRAVMCCRRGV
jgi:hypothetical protein